MSFNLEETRQSRRGDYLDLKRVVFTPHGLVYTVRCIFTPHKWALYYDTWAQSHVDLIVGAAEGALKLLTTRKLFVVGHLYPSLVPKLNRFFFLLLKFITSVVVYKQIFFKRLQCTGPLARCGELKKISNTVSPSPRLCRHWVMLWRKITGPPCQLFCCSTNSEDPWPGGLTRGLWSLSMCWWPQGLSCPAVLPPPLVFLSALFVGIFQAPRPRVESFEDPLPNHPSLVAQ